MNNQIILGNLILLVFILVVLGGALEWASIYLGYKRYFLSAEMLIAFLVAAVGFFKIGMLIFLFSILSEVALGAISTLFLFDLEQVVTVFGFVFEAKPEFLGIFLLALLASLALFIFAERLQKRLGWMRVFVVICLAFLTQVAFSFRDGNFSLPNLSERKNLIAGSTVYFSNLMLSEHAKVFNLRSHDNVAYVPIANPSAMQQTIKLDVENNHFPQKILLVVAESWGMPKDSAVLNGQIDSVLKSGRIKDVTQGMVQAQGATAFGEFRELCGKLPTKLNLKKISTSDLGECWPKFFKEKGYKTISVHGAHGTMYDRLNWYPVLGLSEMVFKEVLPRSQMTECHSFPGYCDSNIFSVVSEKMKSERKVFLYWLTLSTHMPYDAQDVKNYQKKICDSVFLKGYDNNFCNYQNLQKQFFDELSEFIKDDALKGLRVVVVGDHPPPLLLDSSEFDYFEKNKVPYISFSIQ